MSLLDWIRLLGLVEPGELDETVFLQLCESLEDVEVQVHVPLAVDNSVFLDFDFSRIRLVLESFFKNVFKRIYVLFFQNVLLGFPHLVHLLTGTQTGLILHVAN